jgi:hypothetical protein
VDERLKYSLETALARILKLKPLRSDESGKKRLSMSEKAAERFSRSKEENQALIGT